MQRTICFICFLLMCLSFTSVCSAEHWTLVSRAPGNARIYLDFDSAYYDRDGKTGHVRARIYMPHQSTYTIGTFHYKFEEPPLCKRTMQRLYDENDVLLATSDGDETYFEVPPRSAIYAIMENFLIYVGERS